MKPTDDDRDDHADARPTRVGFAVSKGQPDLDDAAPSASTTADMLRGIVAQSIVMSYHAQVAHWNVVGPNFPQLHALFGGIYAEIAKAVDTLAEDLRTLRVNAPATLGDVIEIADEGIFPASGNTQFIRALEAENLMLIQELTRGYETAEAAGDCGIANRLQDRLLAHQKHGWMLRATMTA